MAGPIRQPINIANLSAYIDKHAPEIKTPLTVKQFGYGQSNPTYLLEASNGEQFVMRKQPPGKLLSKTAHQVDREYRIIHAMHNTDVPVPRAMCLCEDRSVIETPFYIMSYSKGRIFEDPSLPGVSPQERTEMWKSICTTLAKFHRVKPSSVGMEDFGRPWGFYNRQLKTFKRLSADQAIVKDKETGEEVGWIPHYDDMVDFFGDKVTQPEDRSTFVHGDYKVDNVVFHPTEPRVIAILDWEMVSLHPNTPYLNQDITLTLTGNNRPPPLRRNQPNHALHRRLPPHGQRLPPHEPRLHRRQHPRPPHQSPMRGMVRVRSRLSRPPARALVGGSFRHLQRRDHHARDQGAVCAAAG